MDGGEGGASASTSTWKPLRRPGPSHKMAGTVAPRSFQGSNDW